MTQDGAPIDVLTDDILHYILCAFVGDRDLGSCLLAGRRFHVLGPLDLQRRKYRCATVPSVCVAGDVDGLKFALDNADIYLPQGRFDWNGCLFAATVAGSVAMLDMIKDTIRARGTDGPWPVTPVMWWSLAFAAAQRGQDDDVLAWLCLPGNATSSQPAVSAEQVQDLVPMATLVNAIARISDVAALGNGPPAMPSSDDLMAAERALYALFDPVVVARVRASLMGMDHDVRGALCDRISHTSGLDAREALNSVVFGLLDASPVRQHSGVRGAWKRALAKARSFVDAQISRLEGAVWTYYVERSTLGGSDEWALSLPATVPARAADDRPLEPIWRSPRGDTVITPFGPGDGTREMMFWTMIVTDAAEAGHVHILDMLRDRPTEKDDGGPMNAALENGRLDVAEWLCAHGYNRTRAFYLPGRWDGRYVVKDGGQSFLYRALCERRFDVVRVLLGSTADRDTPFERISNCIGRAVVYAVDDALGSGNLAIITWLRERYKRLVDARIAHVRARQRWAPVTHSDEFDPVMRLMASRNP